MNKQVRALALVFTLLATLTSSTVVQAIKGRDNRFSVNYRGPALAPEQAPTTWWGRRKAQWRGLTPRAQKYARMAAAAAAIVGAGLIGYGVKRKFWDKKAEEETTPTAAAAAAAPAVPGVTPVLTEEELLEAVSPGEEMAREAKIREQRVSLLRRALPARKHEKILGSIEAGLLREEDIPQTRGELERWADEKMQATTTQAQRKEVGLQAARFARFIDAKAEADVAAAQAEIQEEEIKKHMRSEVRLLHPGKHERIFRRVEAGLLREVDIPQTQEELERWADEKMQATTTPAQVRDVGSQAAAFSRFIEAKEKAVDAATRAQAFFRGAMLRKKQERTKEAKAAEEAWEAGKTARETERRARVEAVRQKTPEEMAPGFEGKFAEILERRAEAAREAAATQ